MKTEKRKTCIDKKRERWKKIEKKIEQVKKEKGTACALTFMDGCLFMLDLLKERYPSQTK